MLSVCIISADVYHSHIMIQNLVCAIQCELQICACWNADQDPQVDLKLFFNCDLYMLNLNFTDTRSYLHSMECGRRLEQKSGEP